jgi:hypothetical protein
MQEFMFFTSKNCHVFYATGKSFAVFVTIYERTLNLTGNIHLTHKITFNIVTSTKLLFFILNLILAGDLLHSGGHPLINTHICFKTLKVVVLRF